MKHTLKTAWILFLNFLAVNAYSQEIKNDLSNMHLKGNVKTLTKKNYTVDYKFGKEQKTLISISELSFNTKGNLLSDIEYSASQKVKSKRVFKYDKDGFVSEIDDFDSYGKLNNKINFNNNIKDRIIEKTEYESSGELSNKTVCNYNTNWEPTEIKTYGTDGALQFAYEYSYKENVSAMLNDGTIPLLSPKVGNEKKEWSGSDYFDGKIEKSIPTANGTVTTTEYYTDGSRKRFITTLHTATGTKTLTGEIYKSPQKGWVINHYNNRGNKESTIYYNSDGSINRTDDLSKLKIDKTIENGNYISNFTFDKDATITQIDQYHEDEKQPVSTNYLYFNNKKLILNAGIVPIIYKYDTAGYLIEEGIIKGQCKIIYDFENDISGNMIKRIAHVYKDNHLLSMDAALEILYPPLLTGNDENEQDEIKEIIKNYTYDSHKNILAELYFVNKFDKPTTVKIIESTIVYY